MPRANTFVRIPKERVGVVIGPDGTTKKNIEEKLQVELEIDSDAGDVNITVSEKATDPSTLFRAKDVVTALGRGFSPEHAFRLVRDEDAVLELLDLRVVLGSPKPTLNA